MYTISEEIKAQAVKCDRNFCCLTDPEGPSCQLRVCLGGEVCFINKLERNCDYHTTFGYEHVCLCPVRRELYLKYGI